MLLQLQKQFQVGEIRPATVDDFKQLLDIVFSHEGWESKPDKGNFLHNIIPYFDYNNIKSANDSVLYDSVLNVLSPKYANISGGVKVWTKSMPSSPVKMIKVLINNFINNY